MLSPASLVFVPLRSTQNRCPRDIDAESLLAVAEAELPDDLEELIIAILSDGYRSGAPRTYSSDIRSRIKLITRQFMIPGTYVQEEIAKMKGVSQNTISRKLHRIKKHLTGIYREAV